MVEPHDLEAELQRILRKIERMDPFGQMFSEREVLALKLALELSRSLSASCDPSVH